MPSMISISSVLHMGCLSTIMKSHKITNMIDINSEQYTEMPNILSCVLGIHVTVLLFHY